MRLRVHIFIAIALALLVGCSKSAEEPAKDPNSVPISIKSVDVLGPGARNAEASKAQTADAVLVPVRTYYDGAFFKIELPAQDFAKAFGDFTPTVSAIAQGAQKSTLTPDDPNIAALWAEKLDAKVSLYADGEGAVSVGMVKVTLTGGGKLVDGTPLSISHVDDFYLVKNGSRWVVTGYAVLQQIDAPPASPTAQTPTASPSASPSASASPGKTATKSPTKSPTKSGR